MHVGESKVQVRNIGQMSYPMSQARREAAAECADSIVYAGPRQSILSPK